MARRPLHAVVRFSETEEARLRSRNPHAELRPIHRPAVRAWLRHDDRQRAAPRPALLHRGSGDHGGARRRRAPRILIAHRRGRRHDRRRSQSQADSLQAARRRSEDALPREEGAGRRHRRRLRSGRRHRDPRSDGAHRHAVEGRHAEARGAPQARPRLPGRRPQRRHAICRSATSRSTRSIRRSAA